MYTNYGSYKLRGFELLEDTETRLVFYKIFRMSLPPPSDVCLRWALSREECGDPERLCSMERVD